MEWSSRRLPGHLPEYNAKTRYGSSSSTGILVNIDCILTDVLILAIAGRANIDGRPYDGSAAEAATDIVKWLGEPEKVIWCLHDDAPIKPWRVDTTAATEMVEQSTRTKVLTLKHVEPTRLF